LLEAATAADPRRREPAVSEGWDDAELEDDGLGLDLDDDEDEPADPDEAADDDE
jgi:hypothetical protein